MGRSVSTASGAVETCFLDFSEDLCDEVCGPENWDCIVESIQGVLTERFPSLSECDRWVDREDRAILENDHASVVVSEYCGTVALCLVPKEDDGYGDPTSNLHQHWCGQIGPAFRRTVAKAFPESAMVRIGTFSNGESVYRRIQS